MTDPTHAPGWRGRPRRYGPLDGDRRTAFTTRLLTAIAVSIVILVAGIIYMSSGQ